MCQRKSFEAVRGRQELAWLLDSDSHEDILASLHLRDKKIFGRDVVKLEALPRGDPFSTDPADWEMKVDEEGTLPAWFSDERQLWYDRCLRALTETIIPQEKSTGRCGSLTINQPTKLDWLTTVGEDLYIYAGAKLEAPALATVGEDLYIYADAKLEALTTVGGNLYIYAGAKLEAPALATVGEDLYIYAAAKLEAPALATVGKDLYIHAAAKLEAPALREMAGKKYKGGSK